MQVDKDSWAWPIPRTVLVTEMKDGPLLPRVLNLSNSLLIKCLDLLVCLLPIFLVIGMGRYYFCRLIIWIVEMLCSF